MDFQRIRTATGFTLFMLTLAALPVSAQEGGVATPAPAVEAMTSPPTKNFAAKAVEQAQKKGDNAPAPEPLTPGAAVGSVIGAHRFTLSFEPTKLDGMGLVRSKFENEGLFQSVLDSIADQIALPQDVPVTFMDCDVENAYWDPETRSMTMCWNLIALYNRGYEEIKSEDRAFLVNSDQDTVLTGTTLFIMLHELGHGLTSLFNLPITGREEDAVDQFATLMLTGGDEEDQPFDERPSRLALLGAYFFRQLATEPGELGREIFADEHALGQQRYYDVMCLVLGSRPDVYGPVLTPGLYMVADAQEKAPDQFDDEKLTDWLNKTDALNILPYQRAIRCEDEYNKYSASWTYLTGNFMAPAAE